MRLATKLLLLLALCGATAPAAAAGLAPGELLIYYGWPSAINGTYAVDAAAAEFARYDFVVLGDGLEKAGHPDHANTVAIVARIHATAATRVFGYIDLGVITQNLSSAEIALREDEWLAAGADGVFLDDFGYDYGVTRARQNDAVDHAHLRGVPAIANGWNPDDVFGAQVDAAHNPTGAPTRLGAADYYLSESFQVSEGAYQAEAAWFAKATALAAHRAALGFGVLSVTTNDAANAYDPAKFAYAWWSALLCGHAATGWGEYGFAAISCGAPHRQRPAANPGTAFASGIVAASPLYRRLTDTGRVTVDAAGHTGAFVAGATGVGDAAPATPLVALHCAPNPFNPALEIGFELPVTEFATLRVYDVAGRVVVTLLSGRVPAGTSTACWRGANSAGAPVASGVYLVRLEVADTVRTARLTLAR